MSNFKNQLEQYKVLIDNSLMNYVSKPEFDEKRVYEAMEYAFTGGGKRIRPILTLEFCRLCGMDISNALPFACAVEMIHCYSLVHDDLPCMDDDALRRGKPSCHIAYGEAYALLAGDGLLTLAFETMLKNYEGSSVLPQNSARAALELAKQAGYCGMIGGQTVDIASEGKAISLETLKLMHSLKTGALISAACKIGCIIAGASEEKIAAAEEYAKNIGLAFQITDDVLDAVGDTAQLGKTVGSDEAKNKTTFVSLMGVEKSLEIARELTEKAKNELEIFGGDSAFLCELADYLAKRDK